MNGAGPAVLGNNEVSNHRLSVRSLSGNFADRASRGAAFGKSIGNPLWNVQFQPNFHPPNTPFTTGCAEVRKRRFLPNLQYRRFWVESEKRWVSLRVSNAGLRLIDKKGIEAVLKDLRARRALGRD